MSKPYGALILTFYLSCCIPAQDHVRLWPERYRWMDDGSKRRRRNSDEGIGGREGSSALAPNWSSRTTGILLFLPGVHLDPRRSAAMDFDHGSGSCCSRRFTRHRGAHSCRTSWRASADARRKFHLTGVPQQSHWSTAKQADDSIITQISAHLFVRNRTADPLALMDVVLLSKRSRRGCSRGYFSPRGGPQYVRQCHSFWLLCSARHVAASKCTFLIRGVLRRRLGNEVKVRLAVSDDEGHEQRVTFRIRVLPPAPVVAVTPSVEIVSSISDPIEKDVAAVLQAELARYDKHGRTVGGLGSIHLAANRQAIASLARIMESELTQEPELSDNPGSVEIRSDNLDALMSY